MLANTFQGYGLGNASFASGIDGRWEFPVAAERPYSYSRATWAPVGLNGFYTWNYVGEGTTELGAPNYRDVNSLDGVNYSLVNQAITTAGAITLNTTTNHVFNVGDRLDVSNADVVRRVTNKAATTTTVTLTLTADHGVVVGDRIVVAIGDTAFDGTYGVATVSTNDITYAKTNAVAVTSVAVSDPNAVATRVLFNGTYTALAGTSGTGIAIARRVSATTALENSGGSAATYTAAAHGLVVGQLVAITGFTASQFNATGAITATTANSFTLAVTHTANATETPGTAAVVQVTRGTAITTQAVPYGANVSSATSAIPGGYNVPGNLAFNADLPVDRVIKSNEDPTS
jgi:hypothetical protein